MRAVITTGGRIEGAYAARASASIKALAKVRGISMLQRSLDALRGAGIERVAVVGGREVRALCAARVECFVDESDRGAENVDRALHAWNDDEDLLYLTSDLPYISAEALREFLRFVPGGALAMPLTSHEAFQSRFPGAPPYGVRLGHERVVNGGVFAIPSGAIRGIAGAAQALFDARKSPWRMARLVGPTMLARLMFGRLSVAALEAHAGRVLGFPAIAIRESPPELGYDADTLAEYEYACTHA